jgi:hypothetical protein
MSPGSIEALSAAVAALHGCDCSHAGTSTVHEMMEGKTVWRGQVETFALRGHRSADEAFAWAWRDDAGETHYVAVLAVPPVNSPRDAVQAAIASGNAGT